MRKKTHEKYIAELALKNPTVEAVEQYVNAKTKIMHHCLIHDVYWMATPDSVLQGNGCPKCKSNAITSKKTKTHEEYVKTLNTINPMIIPLRRYINSKTPILHKCLKCGYEWLVSPGNLLNHKGCPSCSKRARMTQDEYILKVSLINPDIEVVGAYINALTPIEHRCKRHDFIWMAMPANILRGKGCPICNESHGEKLIRKWLDIYHIEYEVQKKFDNCKDIKPLPFDFYLPCHNVLIEYQGIQHYQPFEHYGGQEKFDNQLKHDKIKADYCKQNDIRLLCIRYDEDIDKSLSNFLFI